MPGGWSGQVLTGRFGPASPGRSPTELPGVKPWQAWLTQLTGDPSSLPDYTVLKYSPGSGVFRARLACADKSIHVIAKRSGALTSFQRLMGVWRTARARRDFEQAFTLIRAEIDTALPLAWIERRRPKRESWLVTQFVPDLVDLDQVALTLLARLETKRARAVKDGITTALVELLDRFDRHRLHHRDLKASNILLQAWDGTVGPVRAWVVDLDGLQRPRIRATSRRWKRLTRLAASLLGYTTVTRTDYFRFLQAYVDRRASRSDASNRPGPTRNHCRALFRKLASRSARYVRRARRRKAHKLDGYTGD